jgi:AraC family transcriptional regulator
MAAPRAAEAVRSFRTLHVGEAVAVRAYDCREGRCGPGAEERSATTTIVLLRRGVFCRHFGSKSAVADVNQAVFFAAGSEYRVSHPADCGDRGTILVPSERVLRDAVGQHDPAAAAHPELRLPFAAGPCDESVYLRHQALARGLQQGTQEPLWAEETALGLVAEVVRAAYSCSGRLGRRQSTDDDQRERIEAVRSLLASRFAEKLSLAALAKAVHSSPFHLARLFKRSTGGPIHRYQTRLRLRAALERLAEGRGDLTQLALDLGFSSHGHFTEAFRREFGRTPSQARAEAGPRGLRQRSKDLEASARA